MKTRNLILLGVLLTPLAHAGVVRHAAKDTSKVVVHTTKDVGKAAKALFKLVV